jgi:hypothetical protein
VTIHVIVRVETNHCGAIPPGLLIVVPQGTVSFTPDKRKVCFENTISGGYSFGEFVAFVEIRDGT